MLSTITILTAFIFAVLYPLCFWVSAADPLKNNFHRFHLGLPCVVGGLVMLGILSSPAAIFLKQLTVLWLLALLGTTAYYWRRDYPNPLVLSVVGIVGLTAFACVLKFSTETGWPGIVVSLLAGGVLTSIVFALNLGHWYLNVHGLPLSHLKRAADVLGILLFMRLFWDAVYLFQGRIVYAGDILTPARFLFTMDGFLLSIGLLFGTLFPLISLYFVYGSLKAKNTQSATGILYVILCAILIGDLTYKYYLVKFGVIL